MFGFTLGGSKIRSPKEGLNLVPHAIPLREGVNREGEAGAVPKNPRSAPHSRSAGAPGPGGEDTGAPLWIQLVPGPAV